jgi:hypothetical protein
MALPRAEEIASMSAMPALAAAAVGDGVVTGSAGGAGGESVGSWRSPSSPGSPAVNAVDKLGAQAQEAVQGLRSPSGGGPAKEGGPGGLRGAIKALEKRTHQEEMDKTKALGDPRQQP